MRGPGFLGFAAADVGFDHAPVFTEVEHLPADCQEGGNRQESCLGLTGGAGRKGWLLQVAKVTCNRDCVRVRRSQLSPQDRRCFNEQGLCLLVVVPGRRHASQAVKAVGDLAMAFAQAGLASRERLMIVLFALIEAAPLEFDLAKPVEAIGGEGVVFAELLDDSQACGVEVIGLGVA